MNTQGLLQRALGALVMGLALAVTSGCGYMQKQGFEAAASEPVNYREKDGRIDLDSICAEQGDNEKGFKRCAREADIWLEQQCNSYRGLYQSSDMGTAERYRREYHKFCDAAAGWDAADAE